MSLMVEIGLVAGALRPAGAGWAFCDLLTCNIWAIWSADAIVTAFSRFWSSFARFGWRCGAGSLRGEGSEGGYLAH